jgi:hypothetical protein
MTVLVSHDHGLPLREVGRVGQMTWRINHPAKCLLPPNTDPLHSSHPINALISNRPSLDLTRAFHASMLNLDDIDGG